MGSTNTVLICTKNRPEFLEKTLSQILSVGLLNIDQILIMDGSIGSDTRQICKKISESSPLLKIKWVPVDGGKPSALNEGFRQLLTYKIIHCVDDDISLPTNYFETIGHFFSLHSEVVGVAPIIQNRTQATKLNKQVNHRHAGQITKSANNYWFDMAENLNSFRYSEWLPGGACSYRSSVLRKIQANVSLHDSIQNYALGDDVDLSLQASEYGKLVCLTFLQVTHNEGPSLTSSTIGMLGARARWKVYLYRKYPAKFSLLRIIFWEFFSGLFHILKRDNLINVRGLIFFFLRLHNELSSSRANAS